MITTKEVSVEEGVIMPKTFPKKSREETQLIEMAHRLGYAVTPISKSRQELARAIASRMVNRKGDFVYQCRRRFPSPTFRYRPWRACFRTTC